MPGVQSVERAFALLHEIAQKPSTLSELSRRTGLATSTVGRLLATLAKDGTVVRDRSGAYRIGPAVTALAAAADPAYSLVEVANRTLVELAARVGESACISIGQGNEIRHVAQINTAHPVQVKDWVGTRAPLHGGSPGLVVLSGWPDAQLERYLERRLLPMTVHTVTAPAVLRERVKQIRTVGHLWTHEEGADGISVVAAPVRNSAGAVIASLHAWGPSYRFPQKGTADRIAHQVVEAAERVSSMLGCRPATGIQ
ncbi:MAG: IclR family transcriptional regulator [Actinomycetia bacterium]|nr:IclR family transcriptional regulator [Actinomycetes bacterium]MCP4960085.1 IclR family transcriptional regulator [Actinomycetes bacterium]